MKKQSLLKRLTAAAAAAFAWLHTSVVIAGLPTAQTSSAAQSGDYIGLGTETTKDGFELIINVVGAVILLGAAWAMISSFMAVQNKKETWSDFGKTIAGGLFACVIGIILITQAKDIF